MIIDVFPLETSGSGSPVGGIEPDTTSAFITTCIPKISVIPVARRYPNKSFAPAAIFSPRNTMNPISVKNPISPINPVSSPIMDRIKSDSENGKKAYFCLEPNIPVPNQPPEQRVKRL